MTDQTPKAFDFGDEAEPPPKPVAVPKAFDFSDAEVAPTTPATLAKAVPRPLFESEDHPAVRDALATVRTDYPSLFAEYEQRLAALFRRVLPVKLALVTDWAEEPLMEQAALLQPITELVRQFSEMEVPALLEAALESAQAQPGLLGKLFKRRRTPAQYKHDLIAARTRLQQLMSDSEVATGNLDESGRNLNLYWIVLAVVSDLATGNPDATLLDVLQQRRTMIQQAVRQAELSVMQMGQVRQQAADLIVQISSFLTVTLPALEMAQTQKDS